MKYVYSFIVFFFVAKSLHAGPVEDLVGPLGEGTAHHIFCPNPAALPTKTGTGTIMQVTNQKTVSFTANPNNAAQKISYDTNDKIQAGGISSAIGGAAVGLNAFGKNTDQLVRNDSRNSSILETFVDKSWQGRFVIDLTSDVRFGFKYRYRRVENRVFGSFSLSAIDATNYKGSLSGYSLGLYDESIDHYGIGIFTEPPMRGKVKISGEEKIITEPGVGGLDGYYRLNQAAVMTYFVKQWSYKRDELSDGSTSPIDQRDMSLLGLDIEQDYFRTRQIGLGLDYHLNKGFSLQAYLYKQSGVFLFDPNKVPGDDKPNEKPMDYYGGGAGIIYADQNFWLRFGLIQNNRSIDTLTASNSRIGIRDLGDYKAQEKAVLIGVGYQ